MMIQMMDHVFATLAVVSFGMAEVVANKSLVRAALFLLNAVVLLLLTRQPVFAVAAAFLVMLGGLLGLIIYVAQQQQQQRQLIYVFKQFRLSPSHPVLFAFKALVAVLLHLVGFWLVPLGMLWVWASETWVKIGVGVGEHFMEWEVAHGAWAAAFYSFLVVFPLLFAPADADSLASGSRYEQDRKYLHYQYKEGVMFVSAAIVGGALLITYAVVAYAADKLFMYEHLVIAGLWAASGVVGILHARRNQSSSIHVLVPTLWTGFMMLGHYKNLFRIDAGHMAAKHLHILQGAFFALGGTCRFFRQVPESVFFFFLGSVCLACSSKGLTTCYMISIQVEDGVDPLEVVPKIVTGSVTMVAALLYPFHEFLICQLRKFLATNSTEAETSYHSYEHVPTAAVDDETHHQA